MFYDFSKFLERLAAPRPQILKKLAQKWQIIAYSTHLVNVFKKKFTMNGFLLATYGI
jgi:hypothetical protein